MELLPLSCSGVLSGVFGVSGVLVLSLGVSGLLAVSVVGSWKFSGLENVAVGSNGTHPVPGKILPAKNGHCYL